MENIGSLRDKMKAMVQEASRKESAEAQLKEQVEKITKDVNRYVIVRRRVSPLNFFKLQYYVTDFFTSLMA